MTFTSDRHALTRGYKRVLKALPGKVELRYYCLNKKCNQVLWYKGRYGQRALSACPKCYCMNYLLLPERF